MGILHGNLEQARAGFIELLIQYKKIVNHDMTVVFDGYRNGPGGEQAQRKGGVKIIFSGLGERADDLIGRFIAATRREWIVVSSDREVVRRAWALNSIPVPSEDFLDVLTYRVNKQAELRKPDEIREEPFSRDDDTTYPDKTPGGNPHRISRKERAVKRALNKL